MHLAWVGLYLFCFVLGWFGGEDVLMFGVWWWLLVEVIYV